jgi:hypothetical protein
MSPVDINVLVEKKLKGIEKEVKSRAVRSSVELLNAERRVLKGQRSGRVYKKPGTYGKTRSKDTRNLLKEYGHKLRGGQLYRASAPGEPPARRTGALRLHWSRGIRKEASSVGNARFTAYIKSNTPYAGYLEKGTNRMASRPYVEKIKQEAKPKIVRIFKEPYNV